MTSKTELKKFVTLYDTHGSLRAVSTATGQPYHTVHNLYRECVDAGLIEESSNHHSRETRTRPRAGGKVSAISVDKMEAGGGKIRRYLLSCAQNNTKLHEGFFANLQAFARHVGAQIMVSRMTYITRREGDADKATATGKKPKSHLYDQTTYWADAIEPYISDDRVQLAPGLVWCGEMNIIPSASDPLSGLDVYTGRASGIFPHTTIAMNSVASNGEEPTKFNYTTGTITQRNYIQRKAGLKADFHHAYGALLVEVDEDGDWFCRQINAGSDGSFYDLDIKVQDGVVSEGHQPKAILWGDIHVELLDPVVRDLAWGEGGLLDTLKPQEQHMGDVLDFHNGRSHHDLKNTLTRFKRHVEGVESVRSGVESVRDFLMSEAHRPWCKTVFVDSNHHHHLGRWLAEQDGRYDPLNAEFWFDMNKRIYALVRKGGSVNYLRECLAEVGMDTKPFKFVGESESYVICRDSAGGIECGMHGDLGPNGSRGSARSFARMGRKANVGHTHSACIIQGIYVAGTCGLLRPDFVRGPSSWSHSHVLTYPNGKRAIITFWKGKWRA